MTAGRIVFHVDTTGLPVVIRESYFPWWTAQGAAGPWRVAPDNMVVVPSAHEVVLTAKPRSIDHAGSWLSVLGLLGAAALGAGDLLKGRRVFKSRRRTAPADDAGEAVTVSG